MAIEEKFIIEVGLNEARMRDENPHVPYTPEEVAADAKRCFDAGAAVVHYHGRGPQGEFLSNDPRTNIETQRLITETTPLIAYPTYSDRIPVADGYYTINSPARERYLHMIEAVKTNVRFEIGPVDLGSMDNNASPIVDPSGGVTGWNVSDGHNMNSGKDQEWLTTFCREHGLTMSFAAFDGVHILNLKNLIDMGCIDGARVYVKFFFLGTSEGPRKLLYYIDQCRDLLGNASVCWTPVVYEANQFMLNTVALSLGGHPRLGIGDWAYTDLGAPTNAQLVERMVEIGRAIGREPASPDEAREIIGIHNPRG